MGRKRRLTKIQREIIAMQASLDQLEEGGRRLDALQPLFRRLGELMEEHGPGPIRSYCAYLNAYKRTAALATQFAAEMVEATKPTVARGLAVLDARDPWDAELYESLQRRGVQDALDRKPPAPPPEGFPLDLLAT